MMKPLQILVRKFAVWIIIKNYFITSDDYEYIFDGSKELMGGVKVGLIGFISLKLWMKYSWKG